MSQKQMYDVHKMILLIILSQIFAVICQNKNIEIDLIYDLNGSFENLKIRNIKPIPQDIPEDYKIHNSEPDFQSIIRNEPGFMDNVERFANRRMSMNENPTIDIPMESQPKMDSSKNKMINNTASHLMKALEEITEFRQELVDEAQKRIRGTTEQVINIKKSELGLRPRQVEPLNAIRGRRMHGDEEYLDRVHFRKTKEIRGIKNNNAYSYMNSNREVTILPIEHRKQDIEKRSTLSAQERDRKAASDIYKFLKEVSLATPRRNRQPAIRLKITRNAPKLITGAEKKITSELHALSKEIDLLALEREQKSKQASSESNKNNEFTPLGPLEKQTKTLVDIAKAIELITSQRAKEALTHLSALSLESKLKSSENFKGLTNSSQLKFSSEHLKNFNLTQREKQLELELEKIRKEIDMLSPETEKKLSTVDILTNKKNISLLSYESSDSAVLATTPETTTTLSTEHETATQLNFHNIMMHKGIDVSHLKPNNRSGLELDTNFEKKAINYEEGREISTITRMANIYSNLYNAGTEIPLSESKKQIEETAKTSIISLNGRKKQPDSVLEQFSRLLNLTLAQRLNEYNNRLGNIETVRLTTITDSNLRHLTKKRSNSAVNVRRRIVAQKIPRPQDQHKEIIIKPQKNNESEIDKFRRQLLMEYDETVE